MKRNIVVLFALVFFFNEIHSNDVSPTVTITQGTLVGHIYNTTYGSYYAFQGIPYAKPPVGDLRFKDPVAPDPWNGTFQATKEGSECLQSSAVGDEDCLFVNVYTPQLPDSSNLLPVMVWIHGGGYTTGSGNLESQGPAFLLNDGVIYVSINYRLQVFGFLSTEDEVVPGNMGMKDQVMALRWVKQNIAAFGGDPEQVTIFGESAGGAAVSLQVLSPMSAGLFRGAISESGSSANPWTLMEKGLARSAAFYHGSILGYNGNSSEELVDFLRTINATDLLTTVSANPMDADKYRLSTSVYYPVVEPNIDGRPGFLTDNPINLLAEGKFNNVSVLTGTNSAESLFTLGVRGILDGTVSPEVIDQNFTKIFRPDLRYCKTEPCGDEMLAKIKSFYFGNESITSDNLEQLIELATDIDFAEGTMYAVEMFSSLGSNSVYLYEFSFDGALSLKAQLPGAENYPGVPHAGELPYIFDTGVEVDAGSTDALVRHVMAALWTNFAKTGNPTPDTADNLTTWLPYTSGATYYLDIDVELNLKTDFRKKRMDFWKELYGST